MASKGQKEEERCRGMHKSFVHSGTDPSATTAQQFCKHTPRSTNKEAPNKNTSPAWTSQIPSALLSMRPRGAAAV